MNCLVIDDINYVQMNLPSIEESVLCLATTGVSHKKDSFTRSFQRPTPDRYQDFLFPLNTRRHDLHASRGGGGGGAINACHGPINIQFDCNIAQRIPLACSSCTKGMHKWVNFASGVVKWQV